MRKWMLAASAAALAISAPALADKGGQGGGHGKGGGQQAQQHGGGGDKGRGHDRVKASQGKEHGNRARVADAHPGKGRGHDNVRVARGDDRGRDHVRVVDVNDDIRFNRRFATNGFARGFIDGCPPGLAKKNNGCLPPGQANKLIGTVFPAAFTGRALIGPYRDWYRDDDRFFYRMGPEGYIYRVNRTNSLIAALIPSALNDYGYYPVGMAYPQPYNFYNVPVQYNSYWPDGGAYDYRYGNGAIYQVDPRTSAITSIVGLLAGDLSVGQPLPLGYSAYNVPLAYRAQYYDTPDAWYRYNDGYVYRVDPTTQLVTAVIRALV